jgi:hypothetical protein
MVFIELLKKVPSNTALHLRRAISIQSAREKLLEKHAIAPSAASACSAAAVERKKTSNISTAGCQ